MDPTSQENSSFGSLGANGGGDVVPKPGDIGANSTGAGGIDTNSMKPTNRDFEDIVIGDDAGGKLKKRMVISVLVAVSLLIIVGTVVALMSIVNKNGTGALFDDETKDSFLSFANHVLYDKESKDKLKVEDGEYAIDSNNLNNTEQQEFLKKAKGLFDSYLASVDEKSDKVPKELLTYNYNLNNNLALVLWITEKPPLDMDALAVDYENLGKEETDNKIRNYYSGYDIYNSYLYNFSEKEIDVAKDMLDFLVFYGENGCIVDGKIDANCVTVLTIPDGLKAKGDSVLDFENDLQTFVRNSKTAIVDGVWEIASLLGVRDEK